MRGRGRYQRLDERGGGAGGLLGFLAFVVFGALLAWAIAMTVVATYRVDPPGTFQCGAATGVDGDLCYDYIIVGGGTAGLAAARRLTDDPTKRVLVLEAGPDYGESLATNEVGDIFRFQRLGLDFPYKYHTMYEGVQEPGLNNRVINHWNGRLLGGSSQDNYMLQFRATQDMWDAFDASVGSPGTFTGAAMYQTFQDLEYLGPNAYTNLATRGDGQLSTQTWKLGPIPQAPTPGSDPSQMMTLFAGATGETAYPTRSYNEPGINIGIFPMGEILYDFNSSNPLLRWSSRRAFVNPSVMDQTTHKGVFPRKLDVLLNSTVKNLINIGTRVVGVDFRGSDGHCHKAYVTREVISAAYLNSAALLQRSGIGPATVLAEAGIAPVLINENVGQNMHVQTIFQAATLWFNITGAGAGLEQVIGLATALLPDVTTPVTPSNRQYLNFGISFVGVPSIMAVAVIQNFPASVGYVKVSSPDPYMGPRVLSGALTNANDMTSLRENVRAFLVDITTSDPSILLLSIDNTTLYDDTLLDAFIRNNLAVQSHFFNFNAMGTDAATSVVDNRFRVHGMTGLRVCDNSVLPMTDGNPSLPASAFGDICARLVLEDAGSPYAKNVHRFPVREKKRAASPHKARLSKVVHPPRAAPTSQEICAAIATYISFLKTLGDSGQRQIDAIINGPVYTTNGCASA